MERRATIIYVHISSPYFIINHTHIGKKESQINQSMYQLITILCYFLNANKTSVTSVKKIEI